MKSDIVVIDGQEFVETDYGKFGLGLELPEVRTMIYPSLGSKLPLLPMDEIKKIVESDEWDFGSSFDTTWITNQNGYGSCAAYGASSALAKARVLNGQGRVDLSGDYLYSLVNGGRDRGSMLDENMMALMNRGVCKRETVPLGGIYRSKYKTDVADREALRFRAHECYTCPDEQSLATALALKMPVVIAIHVSNRWRSFDADDVLAPAPGPGNHCEHLDDITWSSKRGCFLYRKATSHGRDYSGDGYCWTTWERHYESTSRYHQFYCVPSAIDDPQGDNPPFDSDYEPAPLDKPKLTVASSSGCVWCSRWKETVEPKVKAAGYLLSYGDVPGGGGVPRFLLDVGGKTKSKVGYWNFIDIERAVAELQS